MKKPVSELFVNVMNSIYSGKFDVLKNVSKYSEPVDLVTLRRDLRTEHLKNNARAYLAELSRYNLIEGSNSLYEISNLGKLVVNEVEKSPEIKSLRKFERKGSHSYCVEEKILLLALNEGKKSLKEIQSSLGVSKSQVVKSVARLEDDKFIRRSTFKHRYFKLERDLKDLEILNLSNSERKVYKILLARKGEYVMGIDIVNNISNQGYYHSGTFGLLEKGFVSEKRNVLSYDLTRGGKNVALSLERILAVVNKSLGINIASEIRERERTESPEKEKEKIEEGKLKSKKSDWITNTIKSLAK